MAALFVYALVLEPVGFVASTFGLLLFFFRALERQRWLVALGSSLATALLDLPRVQGVAQRAAARRFPGAADAVDLFHGLTYGFSVSLQPSNLVACFIGVFVGTLIGVLPGIGPVATMSLLLPVTFAMSPTASIIMMAGIYYGANVRRIHHVDPREHFPARRPRW